MRQSGSLNLLTLKFRQGRASGLMEEEARRRVAGLRIREARKAAGISQTDLAKQLGLPQSVISDWERGTLQSWRDYTDELCRVLNTEPGYFATQPESSASVNTTSVREIPVVGEVQGGAFRMAYEFPPEERSAIPISADAYPAYRGVQLRALKVTGPSVNELYPDGTFVIVVSAADTDVRPGDKVVVFRRQGGLCESTIKEVRVEDGRVVLHPRSTHPDHQEPIYLEDEDQDGPEIAFVVIGSYKAEERPPPPIQLRRRR